MLQGPPGTGKSQTITNIIAECLAMGKKVLFVSEKASALEVVYRRLKEANLSDFCLPLHSYKVNKKDVLRKLGEVLNLKKEVSLLGEAALAQDLYQLDVLKSRLNAYSQSLFTVVEPLHKTVYQVNRLLATLVSQKDIMFSLDDVLQITPQQYSEALALLKRFADTLSGLQRNTRHNPWRGVSVSFLSHELRHDIQAHLGRLIPQVQMLQKTVQGIERTLLLSVPASWTNLKRMELVLEEAQRTFRVPAF